MIVVIGDTHIGHCLGLSLEIKSNFPELLPIKKQVKEFFCDTIESLRPIEFCLWMGDIIDGEGKKESRFHDTQDITKQIDRAHELVRYVNAKRDIAVFGTPYHTGMTADFEQLIFPDIHTEQRVEIDGIKFHMKHHSGKSGTPVGGDIALRKMMVWNRLQEEKADVILRAHTHEYRFIGDSDTTVISCPGLQFKSPDHYSYARRLNGYYDVGLLHFEDRWPKEHILRIRSEDGYRKYGKDTQRVARRTGKNRGVTPATGRRGKVTHHKGLQQ